MKCSYWVYKINAEKHCGHFRWDQNFFCDDAPLSLSDEGWSSFGADIERFRSLHQGDLIFAYQVEDQELVGIAQVVELRWALAQDHSGRKLQELADLIAKPVVQFPKAVRIHQLRSAQPKTSALNQIAAFQEHLGRGTLLALTEADAEALFEACVNHQPHGKNRSFVLPDDVAEIRRLVLGLRREVGSDWL